MGTSERVHRTAVVASYHVKTAASRFRRKVSRPTEDVGLEHGFRSGLEEINAEHLRAHGIPVIFEAVKVEYEQPAQKRTYSPDFKLPNGILVETKGRFVMEDRKKHLWIKAARPDLDIRFVFQNPKAPIYKGSRTTYAQWAEKHGFKWATKLIPQEWWEEKETKSK